MLNVVVSSVLAPKPLLHLSGREVLLSFVRAFSIDEETGEKGRENRDSTCLNWKEREKGSKRNGEKVKGMSGMNEEIQTQKVSEMFALEDEKG